MHMSTETILITYDCNSKLFHYPPDNELFPFNADDARPLWQIMAEEQMTSEHIARQFHDKLEEISANDIPQVHYEQYYIRKNKQKGRWYRVGFVYPAPGTVIHIIFTDIDDCYKKRLNDILISPIYHDLFCNKRESLYFKRTTPNQNEVNIKKFSIGKHTKTNSLN